MPDSAETKTVQEQFVEVDGLSVRFLHAGRGPALVLVHGLLGYSFSWRRVIPTLAREREVFAVDMPGSGLSDCQPGLDCHLTGAAQRLTRFLDVLGIERCDLAGSSYGGTTALRLATLDPGRVRSLILVAPANPWSRIGRKRLAVLGLPGVTWLFPKFARHVRPINRYFIRRMYGDTSRLSQETIRGYSLPIARAGVMEHAVKITDSWQRDMRELEGAMSKARKIPSLIVWGSKDRLVDICSAQALAANFKTAQTVVLAGAGHLPYEEVPDEFCPPVLEFLRTYSPTQLPGGSNLTI